MSNLRRTQSLGFPKADHHYETGQGDQQVLLRCWCRSMVYQDSQYVPGSGSHCSGPFSKTWGAGCLHLDQIMMDHRIHAKRPGCRGE